MLLAGAWGAVWLWIWLRGRRTLQAFSRPPAAAGPLPRVAAFMPCRNERRTIEAAVRGVLANEVTTLTVVDDGSTDGSAEALAHLEAVEPRLRVRTAAPPGPADFGKPAALAALDAASSDADWLLFVDADVALEADALAFLCQVADREGLDAVSALPEQEMKSFSEQLLMPAVGALIYYVYPPWRIQSEEAPEALANGQVILVRRALYAEWGHREVTHDVLEDRALAEGWKRRGARIALVDGGAYARTRMYEGLRAFVWGWAKNLSPLLGMPRASLGPLRAGTAVALTLGPWLSAFRGGGWAWAALAISVLVQADLRRRGGARPEYALLSPLATLGVLGIWGLSALGHRGLIRVRWKGRALAVPAQQEHA